MWPAGAGPRAAGAASAGADTVIDLLSGTAGEAGGEDNAEDRDEDMDEGVAAAGAEDDGRDGQLSHPTPPADVGTAGPQRSLHPPPPAEEVGQMIPQTPRSLLAGARVPGSPGAAGDGGAPAAADAGRARRRRRDESPEAALDELIAETGPPQYITQRALELSLARAFDTFASTQLAGIIESVAARSMGAVAQGMAEKLATLQAQAAHTEKKTEDLADAVAKLRADLQDALAGCSSTASSSASAAAGGPGAATPPPAAPTFG